MGAVLLYSIVPLCLREAKVREGVPEDLGFALRLLNKIRGPLAVATSSTTASSGVLTVLCSECGGLSWWRAERDISLPPLSLLPSILYARCPPTSSSISPLDVDVRLVDLDWVSRALSPQAVPRPQTIFHDLGITHAARVRSLDPLSRRMKAGCKRARGAVLSQGQPEPPASPDGQAPCRGASGRVGEAGGRVPLSPLPCR